MNTHHCFHLNNIKQLKFILTSLQGLYLSEMNLLHDLKAVPQTPTNFNYCYFLHAQKTLPLMKRVKIKKKRKRNRLESDERKSPEDTEKM